MFILWSDNNFIGSITGLTINNLCFVIFLLWWCNWKWHVWWSILLHLALLNLKLLYLFCFLIFFLFIILIFLNVGIYNWNWQKSNLSLLIKSQCWLLVVLIAGIRCCKLTLLDEWIDGLVVSKWRIFLAQLIDSCIIWVIDNGRSSRSNIKRVIKTCIIQVRVRRRAHLRLICLQFIHILPFITKKASIDDCIGASMQSTSYTDLLSVLIDHVLLIISNWSLRAHLCSASATLQLRSISSNTITATGH